MVGLTFSPPRVYCSHNIQLCTISNSILWNEIKWHDMINLAGNCKGMTELGFASAKFSEHFCYWACFNATVEQLVQFLWPSCYLDDFRALLVELCRRCKTHRNQFHCLGLYAVFKKKNRNRLHQKNIKIAHTVTHKHSNWQSKRLLSAHSLCNAQIS